MLKISTRLGLQDVIFHNSKIVIKKNQNCFALKQFSIHGTFDKNSFDQIDSLWHHIISHSLTKSIKNETFLAVDHVKLDCTNDWFCLHYEIFRLISLHQPTEGTIKQFELSPTHVTINYPFTLSCSSSWPCQILNNSINATKFDEKQFRFYR